MEEEESTTTTTTKEPRVELIAFENPSEARIFLPRILWKEDKLGLLELLREKMSPYGLLHHLFADCSRGAAGQADSEGFRNWFAAADFFSRHSAEKARLFCHENLVINGRLCKVLRSTRDAKTDLPLSLRKCEELANFYLGFNGWNSEILCQKPADDSCGNSSFLTVVRLSFPGRGLTGEEVVVEAAGMAAARTEQGRGAAVAAARKQSKAMAMQNAFAKVLLVVLDGGKKVRVQADLAKQDAVHYDATWETYEAGRVQEVDYEVGGEEEEDD